MRKPVVKGISNRIMNQLFSSHVPKTLTSKIRQKEKSVMPVSVVWSFFTLFSNMQYFNLRWKRFMFRSLSSLTVSKNVIPGSGIKAPTIGKVLSVPHTKPVLLCTSPDQERR